MGVNTNQIATEKDLYFRGYTAFNSGSTQAVTKQDIKEQLDKKLIVRISVNNDNSTVMTSTTTTHLSTNESVGIISANTTYTHVIQTYDTSFLSKNKYILFYNDINSSLEAEEHGGWCFNVRNPSSSVNLQYYLYIIFNGVTPSLGAESSNAFLIESGTLYYNSTKTFQNNLWMSKNGEFIKHFYGKTSAKLVIYIKNTSSSRVEVGLKNLKPSANFFNVLYYPSNKCVKFSDYGLSSSTISCHWDCVITEGISTTTRANTITFYYVYKATSTSSEVSQAIGTATLNNGNNINVSATTLTTVYTNPYRNRTAAPYYAYLAVHCGTTNNNQTWKYKLRTKSTSNGLTGSWDTAYSTFSDGKGKEKVVKFYHSNATAGNTGNQYFLEAIKNFNGIEFNITA